MSTFLATRHEHHPTELAALQGARVVAANETGTGSRWNEARIKTLTGGDRISARFMYGDFYSYTPQFKLLLVGNHKPSFGTVDAAIQRRLHLIPFTVQPASPDLALGDKLRDEGPAILQWMIDGCLLWQILGLDPPAVIRAATDAYFQDQDTVGRWLADACEQSGEGTAFTRELYFSWSMWCGAAGESARSEKWLVETLQSRGFERWKHPVSRRAGFRDLVILPAPEFPWLPTGSEVLAGATR